jgi:hypothetical protein
MGHDFYDLLITTLVPWDSAKLQVPIEPLPWPTNKLERVSVNSFGIGGSNAHVSILLDLKHSVGLMHL